MRSDRLLAMEIFIRVVEAGSFSAAASQLGIGQPAVSKIIAQLEERLGVQLLLRSTRSLSVTDAGKAFYDNARRAIGQVDQAETAARRESGLVGTLKVSASVCFTRIHIMPRLSEFLAQHPDVDIHVITDDRFVDLIEEGIDLALRTGSLTDSSLAARKIGQSSRRVMATARYFKTHGTPRTPDDLLEHECLVLQRNGRSIDTWTFHNTAGERSMQVRGRIKVASAEALREGVLADLGIAIVTEWLFSPELASGLVETALADWQLPRQDLWAVFPPGKMVNEKARAFVAYVERCMAAPFAPNPVVLRSIA